jgi:alpha-1,3-rhamnosyl/mannosyltransferase
MKVILSTESIRFPLTGIGRYAFELASHLRQSRQLQELRFFSGSGFVDDIPGAAEHSDGRYRLRRMAQKSRLLSGGYRALKEHAGRRALKDCGDYIYHGPNFYLPAFPGPMVATFHDLSPFKWQHCHAPERLRFMVRECQKTIQRADALITDSAYTRKEVADYFSWPMEKIHVVPLACGPEFRPRRAAELSGLARYKLQYRSYTLFVGTIEPRKNIVALLDAYARLPLPLRRSRPLVLTGYRGWRSAAIHARIAAAYREGWATYLGFTPAEDLPMLYAGAALFAFPSLYEGFGLPVLEAMASGVPVVCSTSSSLPEVVGDAALACEPQDVDRLAELLGRGLQDEGWRAQAIARGLRRAAGFSWSRCADETLAVYGVLAGAP